MTDNFALPATGITGASDNIGGVHHQRVKVEFGVNGVAADVSATDPLPVAQAGSATSVVSSVTAATASTALLAAKSTRIAATVFNDSTAILYLKLGATASTTSFTCKLAAGGYYELPTSSGVYTGAIDGIWSAVNGAARVTEVG